MGLCYVGTRHLEGKRYAATFKWQEATGLSEGSEDRRAGVTHGFYPGSGENVTPWKTEKAEKGMSPGIGV